MLVDGELRGEYNLLDDLVQKASRVGAGMWGTKEDDADSGLEDKVKMGLAELTSPCPPQHLLNDNTAKAVYDELNRSRGIIASTPFQGDEEVPGDIAEGILVDSRPCLVSDSGVVSICQDSGMWYS
jgi:hypothetical protein